MRRRHAARPLAECIIAPPDTPRIPPLCIKQNALLNEATYIYMTTYMYMAGWCLAAWLAGWLAGWQLAGWLAGKLAGLWLAGWPAGLWLAGWLVDWLAGKLAG